MDERRHLDWIEVGGMETRCVLGVYDWERERERPVKLDVWVGTDARAAAEGDDFGKALNYEQVEAAALRTAKEGAFRLVETLAERVAAAVLELPGAAAVRVRVEKPGALAESRFVAVTVERWAQAQE